MPKDDPFEAEAERYDAWFDRHAHAYLSELLALRAFVPLQGRGLEIGVGTGRFAAPLGVALGIDPAPAMLARAAQRGVQVARGVAERLPLPAHSLDHALLVTVLCFLDDPDAMLREVKRVLRPRGRLVIGCIDRASPQGQDYERRKSESAFYREARFFSAAEVERLLVSHGFAIAGWGQTLAAPAAGLRAIEPVRPGHGLGLFAVVAATSPG